MAARRSGVEDASTGSSDARLVVQPLGDGLTLRRRGEVVDVVLGNVVLLSSAALETELGFGRMAREITKRPLARVVVGGLGFAATVRGVLEVAAPETRVVVVEKLPAIVKLARGELAHLTGGALDDPRVEVVEADVGEVIERERDVDALLLDVDNGPGWASFRTNARLYGEAGLRAAQRALAPGGALAVWSGYPADAFVGSLRRAGFEPSLVPLRERGVVRARAYVGVRQG